MLDVIAFENEEPDPASLAHPTSQSARTFVADLVHSDLVLGVDGGGTKTVAWLADGRAGEGETILGKGLGGPGNPRAVGFEQALSNLDAAIDAAFSDAGSTRCTVAAACLALAGSDRDADRARFEPGLISDTSHNSWRWSTMRSRFCSLAHLMGCGVALIAGTGSLAYGRNERGDTRGSEAGDTCWATKEAATPLPLAACALPWRGGRPRAIHSAAGSTSAASRANRPQQLVEVIYAPDMERRRLAQLAPVVLEAAEAGDAVAIHLVDAAARDLCEMVDVLCARLSWEPRTLPLALAGSLLLGSRLLASSF